MSKKGDVSLTYIVIAALSLVALVVIILFFTGGMQKLITGQQEVLEGTVPDWQMKAWTTRCEFACTQENKADFCGATFTADTNKDNQDDVYYVCNTAKTTATAPNVDVKGPQDLNIQCDKINSCS